MVFLGPLALGPPSSALGPHVEKLKFFVVNSVLSTSSSWILPSLLLSLPYPAGIYLLKVKMKSPMEYRGKVIDNYLINLKFTVSKAGLKILCHVALICTIFCITDLICSVACQEIEAVRFLGWFHICLFLNYLSQTTKSNL